MRRLVLAILTVGIITTAGLGVDSFASSRSERLAEKLALEADLQAAAPVVPAYPITDGLPLEWEHKHPERKPWSQYSYSVINAYFNLLNEADDMTDFCPNYDKLTYNQKVQAWAQIFVGISHWESSWNPTEATLEGDGDDDVTHKANESDMDRLQMSYGETSDLMPLRLRRGQEPSIGKYSSHDLQPLYQSLLRHPHLGGRHRPEYGSKWRPQDHLQRRVDDDDSVRSPS